MTCTLAEWLRWLPDAACPAQVAVCGDSARIAPVGAGVLQLDWQRLPARRIGLLGLPRLRVRFRFEGVADADRHAFMRRFDLATQRGGG